MTSDEEKEMVRHFGQYVVSLGWIDRTPGARASDNNGRGHAQRVSGFLVSVKENWFLITAGHILEDIETARRRGQTLEHFFLDDSWGSQKHNAPIPFAFDDAEKQHINSDDEGLDIAVVKLRPHYKDLLKAGKTLAFDEVAWKGPPESFDTLKVVGFPSQFGSSESDGGEILMKDTCVLLPMIPIDEPVELNREFPRIYGAVARKLLSTDKKSELNDLDGMSGGPILGFKLTNSGPHYWLVGIQSGYNKTRVGTFQPGQVVIGCLFRPLGVAIEHWIGGNDVVLR